MATPDAAIVSRAIGESDAFHAQRPRRRILMVAARYFPFMGGIETHIHEVGTRLAARGCDVTVLTTDPSGTWPAEEIVSGMRVLRVKAWPARRDYYLAPGIFTTLMNGTWDVVHIQGYNTFVAPLALMAAGKRGLRTVLTFHSGGHSSRFRQSIRGVQQALLAPLVAHVSQLVAVSAFEVDLFSRRMGLPRERFVIIPNGASMPSVPAQDVQVASHLVISIGRLERYKGHHKVIEAFPAVLRRVPAARLRVLGEGPYERPLRDLVQKLGLESYVTIGAIPPSERGRLASVVSGAGLVVLLSEYEAHPVAVMEALALRRPVLVSDTSGLRELAQKGLCQSVPLDAGKAEIADAIAEELLAPHAIPEASLPDWDGCAAALAGVYEDVINGRGP
ncbi:glycosyltransferase family 4 protein [Microbacteriaceae bacterium K1510]|nr:glycosyltransferase family 4 protein [Microbacteriaceae bacterium K1510]